VRKIILVGTTPAPVDRFGRKRSDFTKVSLGAEEFISWEVGKSISSVIEDLKDQDFKIIALEQHPHSTKLKNLQTFKLTNFALIVGNEVDGVSEEAIEASEAILEIPMRGKKESLNVSVSTGIACSCYYRNMLNVFPDLLNYSLLAPFILRLVIGVIFIDLGILKFRSEKERWMASFNTLGLRPADLFVPLYGLVQLAGGVLLVVGLWTQAAALIFVILTGIELYIEWSAKEILKRDMVFYVLLFAISLSILVTGAGAYAIDLPL
jgi:uncharacterized membrane protein YphA (DoxX/SURF4 family)/tRNA(Leu) C34 or U34 (ribose-2'-O)-methylase TrmL